MISDFVYDVETYPNYFCCTVKHVVTGDRWIFEIFDGHLNQSVELRNFVYALRENGARMVGFNNYGFDYPIIHMLCTLVSLQGYATAAELHAKAQQIIFSGDRFGNVIWDDQQIVPQVDLYKIHHFDNVAKATSLKVLEFNMRSAHVEDIPHDPSQPVTWAQAQEILQYNCHDVNETGRFYHHTAPAIRFREELSAKYGRNFLNHNDTKIGKDYFVMKLEEAQPGICFTSSPGQRRQPRQTFRESIPLRSVIFPYVQFRTEPFRRVLDYLQTVTITNTKSAPELKDLHAIMRGFRFDFGTGGIHGSLNNVVVRSDAEHEVIDVDVASYYPNLAIVNRVFPQHLGETFCDIYADLYQQRKMFPKKSAENAMLKLALNGVYGDSNNVYSPFYDPAYTMAITINGQLLLCMLAEWLLDHPLIEPLQINTDGITVRVHRDARSYFNECFSAWQNFTRLELESVNYSAMFIRDVNNYMAVKSDGSVKRIGAYAHETQADNPGTRELWWNKDWSARVIPIAVQAALVDGADVERFIYAHPDPFDFMLRYRVPRNSRIELSDGTPLPQTVRYHIATDGPGLVKVMPQLAKTMAAKPDAPKQRHFRVNVGWSVNVCNYAHHFDWSRLDRRFYIEEARKLMGMIE